MNTISMRLPTALDACQKEYTENTAKAMITRGRCQAYYFAGKGYMPAATILCSLIGRLVHFTSVTVHFI
jgi:hypothetical protein